jgi:hypothetical protein
MSRRWIVAAGAAALALFAGACGEKTPQSAGTPEDRPEVLPRLAIDAPREAAERAEVALALRADPPLSDGPRIAWRQLPGGPRVVLSGWNTPRASFRAPEDTTDYSLAFEVEIADGAGTQRAGPAEIRVRCKDDPPEVECFAPAASECGSLVVLQGQGRSYEQQQALAFEWLQVGEGPRVALDSPRSQQASFVAPEASGAYALEFELHVRDGVNPDVVAKVRVEIECDPSAAALAAGEERALLPQPELLDGTRAPAERSFPIPRGAWQLTGTLAPRADDAPSGPASATFRFEYSEHHAAAIEARRIEDRLSLRMLGLQRGEHAGPWVEPESSGERPLGELELARGVGFAFEWDGRELGVRYGPAGDPSTWPEPDFPISFPLAARPRAFAIDVRGFSAEISGWSIVGR